jgi:hypothetical protein
MRSRFIVLRNERGDFFGQVLCLGTQIVPLGKLLDGAIAEFDLVRERATVFSVCTFAFFGGSKESVDELA